MEIKEIKKQLSILAALAKARKLRNYIHKRDIIVQTHGRASQLGASTLALFDHNSLLISYYPEILITPLKYFFLKREERFYLKTIE